MDYDNEWRSDLPYMPPINHLIDLKSIMVDYQLAIAKWCKFRNINPNEYLQPSHMVAVYTRLEFSVTGYLKALTEYFEFAFYRGSKYNHVDYPDTSILIKYIHPWLELPGYDYLTGALQTELDKHFSHVWKEIVSKVKSEHVDNGWLLWTFKTLGNHRISITMDGDVRLIEAMIKSISYGKEQTD